MKSRYVWLSEAKASYDNLVSTQKSVRGWKARDWEKESKAAKDLLADHQKKFLKLLKYHKSVKSVLSEVKHRSSLDNRNVGARVKKLTELMCKSGVASTLAVTIASVFESLQGPDRFATIRIQEDLGDHELSAKNKDWNQPRTMFTPPESDDATYWHKMMNEAFLTVQTQALEKHEEGVGSLQRASEKDPRATHAVAKSGDLNLTFNVPAAEAHSPEDFELQKSFTPVLYARLCGLDTHFQSPTGWLCGVLVSAQRIFLHLLDIDLRHHRQRADNRHFKSLFGRPGRLDHGEDSAIHNWGGATLLQPDRMHSHCGAHWRGE